MTETAEPGAELPERSTLTRVRDAVRHPGTWLSDIAGGGPVYALLVLFGLNAVDELDRTGFGILLPEIREDFGLSLQGILTLIAAVTLVALVVQIPIANLSDRHNRVYIAAAGAAAWGMFSLLTGLAVTVVMLAIVRMGSGIGKGVVDPTHNSLIADYYSPTVRPRVYSFHRAANAVGAFIGPLVAGLLAFQFNWRVPFIVFAIPSLVFVVLALRMKEPVRGAQERAATGASEEAIATEELRPSFAESWRTVWKIESLRRIWYSLPFLGTSLIGFVALASLLYEDTFGLDERARGFVAAGVEPAQLIGLVIGARVGTKLMARDPALVLRFLSAVSFVVSAALVTFALAPNIAVAVVANAVVAASLALLGPGILAALSLAIPPRSRSIGFSVGALWIIPGLVLLPVIGAIGDRFNIRVGLLVLVPIFLIGGLVIATAGSTINADITQVWAASAARSEALYERRQGRSRLLLVRNLDVFYGNLQVLFGVDFEVDEGQIVALLGTNGAGKSTLLRAIAGLTEADKGAVIFDGRDTTHAPPDEVAAAGIVAMPGGASVFGDLTVRENLRVAGWLHRHDRRAVRDGVDRVLDMFPMLAQRLDDPAANLSGGQQQMLGLGMAFLSQPRLLMIDELSLGLAPVVVEQLLPIVREISEAGTTIILVEQSVNVALTVAETAYFMEKGQIRFHGPTAELLERPDVLRSVFLEGAGAAVTTSTGNGAAGDVAAERAGPSAVAAVPAADDEPALLAAELSVSFGGIRAVDGVSLAARPGEIVGIIGPNGAGKTTLFDLISGFTSADSGRIQLGSVDITRQGPDRRAVNGLGRSFQDARLWPALTVEETIGVSLDRWVRTKDPLSALLHLPTVFDSEEAVAERVDELIDLLGLEAFRNKFVRELSTGSRRIVDLACVVAHRPTVVLLDEPSSGIAQRETEALAPLLTRIRDELGAALLVIEHDMPLVTAISDRLVAMDQGAVIADGPSTEVLHDPVVIAAYLGDTEAVIARSGASTLS